MKGGRKNLKRATEEETLTLQEGESIVQVLSLRGSNLIEILDARGEKEMALFPAKFQKSMWIKKGSFVVVDDSGREQAIENGRKVTCMVSRVLFHDQVRALQKTPQWPEIFKPAVVEDASKVSTEGSSPQDENHRLDPSAAAADGLPPLEPNTNRRPLGLPSDSESDSDDGLPPLEPNTNRRPLEPPSDTESDSD